MTSTPSPRCALEHLLENVICGAAALFEIMHVQSVTPPTYTHTQGLTIYYITSSITTAGKKQRRIQWIPTHGWIIEQLSLTLLIKRFSMNSSEVKSMISSASKIWPLQYKSASNCSLPLLPCKCQLSQESFGTIKDYFMRTKQQNHDGSFY